MRIASTVPLRDKHRHALITQFPDQSFSFSTSIAEVLDSDKEAEILLTYGDDVDEKSLSGLPHVKWIQVLSAGLDQIPFGLLREKGILLTNARGIHGIQMAEYTLGVMLHHARALGSFYHNQLDKVWDRRVRVDELYEKQLGIIGTGAIGTEIAKRAAAFGMKVFGLSRSGREASPYIHVYKREDLPLLLRGSDYIVVITPLTPETEGMIGEAEFRMMKKGTVLINIARGEVVDEGALLMALREGILSAAYLDVFREEPLPPDHPLWHEPGCYITPHVSGLTPRYLERALSVFTANLQAYLNGHPEAMGNRIDLTKGY